VEAVESAQRPIRLIVRDDDLRRNATVFLRLVLALPHLVWLTLWGIAASVVAFVNWLAVLIQGEVPESLHDFVAGYLRYATHVSAYVFVVADAYPGFRGAPGYAVDLEIDPPERQSRWSGFFRLLLALPALLLAGVLGSGFTASGSLGGSTYGIAALYGGLGAGAVAAMLTWCAALVIGRAPRGLRDLMIYAIGYGAQAGAYFLLLTPRYPTSDPALAEPYSQLPNHPVRAVVTDNLGRPRLVVFFRLLLAIPHFVWITLWSIAVFFAVLVAWVVALATGRVPEAFHRFLAAYVRYATHLVAFVYLIGRRFPGFTGKAGSYGIDLEIDPRERQSRWKVLFRIVLSFPALLVASALGSVAFVIALLGWWYALVKARMPEGMRNLGVVCLRYSAQTYAYSLLVTDRYPYAAPVLRNARPEAVVPAGSPTPAVGDAF
jgi:Domain of unknown function (DUF4389)